ncbi:hypothetical protein HHI36_012129 [Cryptolaemus montrouzieri]|uniref:IQ motif and ubiquitin-like domain-containing protein n=1 Tax=Cryptolaemus montrouzieri TaxID=559131 RepID=A0ABD2NEH9_9CUCU
MQEGENSNVSLLEKEKKKPLKRKIGEELQDDIPIYIFDISLTERKSRLAVKFSTTDGEIFAQSFQPDTEYDHIKSIVAGVIEVKPRRLKHNVIKLKLMKHEQINEFKNDPHEAIPCMFASKIFMRRLARQCKYEELVIPDYICVNVKDSTTDATRCVRVEVYNRAIDKPWDGGYRDTRTLIEYHNAFTQTGPRPPVRGPDLMSNRDTQTSWCRNRRVDMPYSQATQMYKEDLFIPCITDRILTPRPYETSEQLEKRIDIETRVRTIQRYYRIWKMRKCLKEMSEDYHMRQSKELEREQEEIEEDWRRRRKDLICQVFPRTQVDFGMLFAMAEKWKKAEIAKICAMYCGPAKIAELALLSDKEVEVFKAIDKLQKDVKRDAHRQQDLNYLKKLGEPTKWYCQYKYIPVQLDSLENQKARQIDTLYQKVVDRAASEPKRMDALLELKLSLKNDDCEIAMELTVLIDRAINLLSRGFSNKKIESLQKRIDATVLQHYKQKECFDMLSTPEQQKAKEEYLRANLFTCNRCRQLKTIDCFKLNARTEQVNICNSCKWLDKTIEPWADLSPYRFILNQIRRSERLNNSPSSVAYILQDRDIHHLVTQIWHSHSAISECKDIYNLRMVRWHRESDWSPWNCILLTLQEGKAHIKIDKLEEVYEEEFINHVFNKHALARKHFKDLMSIDSQFKSMYRISSIHNLDPNGYNDFRKIFKIDRTKRLYF